LSLSCSRKDGTDHISLQPFSCTSITSPLRQVSTFRIKCRGLLLTLLNRRTIPLVDIVDSFDVFHSGTGAQGFLQRPSQQELDTVFGTHNVSPLLTSIDHC
jgi:hypothetical protein